MERVRITHRRFSRANLNVEEPVGRLKRGFSVATGCWARLSWHLRAGAGTRANGGRAQWRSSRSRPARSAASMRTEASTEKPPPCSHCPIACASSPGSRPRRTKSEREIDAAFASLAQLRAGGLVVAADPLFNSWRAQLVELAARHRIPAILLPARGNPADIQNRIRKP